MGAMPSTPRTQARVECSTRLQLDPSFAAAGRARRAVDELLGERDDAKFRFYLRLVVTELVANAVVHGSRRDPITLTIDRYRDVAEVRVENAGDRLLLQNLRRKRRVRGRGLEIVEALSETWSIKTGDSGTTITARLAPDRLAPTRNRRARAGRAVQPLPVRR
jgi:anti-sigma regulatory factor (Ser/Thr protein kinase)